MPGAALTPLSERLAEVRRDIDRAARASGRRGDAVALVVVTKSVAPGIFAAALAAGVTDVGESRVQAGVQRRAQAPGGLRWHLAGSLQSNKVRAAVAAFDVLHGIDSTALLERIERAAAELSRRPALYLQVNTSGEVSKHGLVPAALPEALERAAGLRHARLAGLMTMAPAGDPQSARTAFAALRALRDRLAPGAGLSMGMSDDFVTAVEEGSTCVRIGRRLVAGLTAPALERA
jgi:pyridoxal phosphate enzyme (YggS family)